MLRKGLRENNYLNSKPNNQKIEAYCNYLIKWLQSRVKKAMANGLIVGVSGGIDSALVSALAKKAFPKNTLGVVMPIDSMELDLKDIQELVNNIDLEILTIDLKSTFEAIKFATNITNSMSISNIKPRLRMTTLYALAQQKNYLVVGTDNEDEIYIGYFTKYGDGGVDILPISRLLKNEVQLMASFLNVPDSIINKKPSAGLWVGQNDEDELGFSYNELDNYLNNNLDLVSNDALIKIKKLHNLTHHKRQKPYQPKTIEQYFKKEN
ncbi:NAD(+) synthase [Mycoplasmopsis phocirhinis]|uniref:NH(3)-dependent NAD(+) synthetase n=1 Tax=Mycoplasmopsis phocirhinis TaxID=142650 RepID=A0A4V0ZAD9_9BACT|nr:NAD(+) synthase [Mycoplasmopsis phocirhinis]QBF34362.1 NAD(+) synthase [Mycoplasmopsis phocirhinis]